MGLLQGKPFQQFDRASGRWIWKTPEPIEMGINAKPVVKYSGSDEPESNLAKPAEPKKRIRLMSDKQDRNRYNVLIEFLGSADPEMPKTVQWILYRRRDPNGYSYSEFNRYSKMRPKYMSQA